MLSGCEDTTLSSTAFTKRKKMDTALNKKEKKDQRALSTIGLIFIMPLSEFR